ncbi:hypothetical protein FPQ18DRAFT_301661 [Pyronema domesticum]|nr:hypothetical protein FPQ18DRAFT_301661 [Pyronema domesticum]
MAFQQKETTIENLNKYLQDFRRQVDKGIDNQREALNVLKQTQSQLTEFHHRFNEQCLLPMRPQNAISSSNTSLVPQQLLPTPPEAAEQVPAPPAQPQTQSKFVTGLKIRQLQEEQ